MESYYGIPLTPEFYNRLHEIGYHWVTDFNRYSLLMRSIIRAGADWDTAKIELEKPTNIECFKNGPSEREGWIDEVNKLNEQRSIKLDYSTLDHLSWAEKMRMEQQLPDRSISDTESIDIYNKWSGRRSGRIKW